MDIPLFSREPPGAPIILQISLAYGVSSQSRDSSRRRFLIWFENIKHLGWKTYRVKMKNKKLYIIYNFELEVYLIFLNLY